MLRFRSPLLAPSLFLLNACSGDASNPGASTTGLGPTTGAASTLAGATTDMGSTATTSSGVNGVTSNVGGGANSSSAATGTVTVGNASNGSVTTSTGGMVGGGQTFTSAVGAGGSSAANGTNGADGTNGTSGTSVSTSGNAGSGGGTSAADVFGSCRFHFGAIDQFARNNPSIAAELDFFTPGWMGIRDTFDQGYVCDDTDPGGPLEGLVPVVVAYVAAFYAKRHNNLNDCNVGSPDLCTHGSLFIKQNLANIVNVYRDYAQGYAACFGTTRPIVFEMEPDYYQYTNDSQTDPMTVSEAGSIMSQFVNTIREQLPNAVFSMDISPWVAPNNGSDHGADWYSNFDMSLFSFVHTSGGSTDASSATIRGSNNMTWAGVSSASGKRVLADTGYGVNGSSEGHDSNWDNPDYINARIADGVVSISQYNPNSNWGNTIAQIRNQLDTPPGCQ